MDEPASAEIDVDLPAEVTGWGQPLLDVLARTCGLPTVSEVWVRDADGELEGPLPGGKRSWRFVSEPDVTVLVRGTGSSSVSAGRSVVSTTRHPTASSHASLGFEFPTLTEGEQNWRRVQALFLDEPCIVPRVMQEVRSIAVS